MCGVSGEVPVQGLQGLRKGWISGDVPEPLEGHGRPIEVGVQETWDDLGQYAPGQEGLVGRVYFQVSQLRGRV